jgi:hypothetical protein
MLSAKYNISFLDTIGRPPRVLLFEYFRSFKVWRLMLLVSTDRLVLIECFQVLQAFIQHDFKDLPGAAWVGRGRYLGLSLANNRTLDERNWSLFVAPGTTIAMSMVMRKLLDASNLTETRCPETSCPGTWPRSETGSWVKW